MLKAQKIMEVWGNTWDMEHNAQWQARGRVVEGALSFDIINRTNVNDDHSPADAFTGKMVCTVNYYDAISDGDYAMSVPLHKAMFEIDGGPDQIEGYTDGRKWNGWATPKFTQAAFEEWLNKTDNVWERRPVSVIAINLEGNDPAWQEVHPLPYTVNGKELWLYDVDGWCWDEVEGSPVGDVWPDGGACGMQDRISKELGVEWDTDSNIAIMAGFIEANCDPEVFGAYITKMAEGEVRAGKEMEPDEPECTETLTDPTDQHKDVELSCEQFEDLRSKGIIEDTVEGATIAQGHTWEEAMLALGWWTK